MPVLAQCFIKPWYVHVPYRQDYYNLMSVYLDSVFHPLLREQDFLQEGWRLENEEIEVGRFLSGVKTTFPSGPFLAAGHQGCCL